MQRRTMLQLDVTEAAGTAASDVAGAAPASFRPQGSRVKTRNGIELHYADWGEGKPVITDRARC